MFVFIRVAFSWEVVVHAFNPSMWEAEAGGANLVYRVSSSSRPQAEVSKGKIKET